MPDPEYTQSLIKELRHLADSCCDGTNFTSEHCIAGRAATELKRQSERIKYFQDSIIEIDHRVSAILLSGNKP